MEMKAESERPVIKAKRVKPFTFFIGGIMKRE
jgi:hypothetical protein